MSAVGVREGKTVQFAISTTTTDVVKLTRYTNFEAFD